MLSEYMLFVYRMFEPNPSAIVRFDTCENASRIASPTALRELGSFAHTTTWKACSCRSHSVVTVPVVPTRAAVTDMPAGRVMTGPELVVPGYFAAINVASPVAIDVSVSVGWAG